QVLSIAPTHGEAHRYLAMLEMEAGLEESARTRYRLVADVERTTSFPLTQLARWHALDGDLERAEQLFAEAARRSPTPSMGVVLMRLRDAVWRRTPPPKLSRNEETWLARAPWPLPRLFTAALAGELTVDRLLAEEAEVLKMGQSPRATATVHQFATELLLYLGDVDAAIEHLIRCEAIGLMDVSWLDRCPLLEPLRGHSAFHSVSRRVRARALAAFASAPTLHTLT
ncbi:MAG: hypothetical protein KC486_13855, partial [Myxococcales bacterium]|nr:hypothetical protein [Myxococcales bacterium]